MFARYDPVESGSIELIAEAKIDCTQIHGSRTIKSVLNNCLTNWIVKYVDVDEISCNLGLVMSKVNRMQILYIQPVKKEYRLAIKIRFNQSEFGSNSN